MTLRTLHRTPALRHPRVAAVLLVTAFALVMMRFAPVGAQDARPSAVALADLKPIEVDDRLLVADPGIEVAEEGTATLAFSTMVATPAVRVFFGRPNPDALADATQWRVEARETLKAPAVAHEVSIDLKRLETAAERAPAAPDRDVGIWFRIEMYDPRTAGTRYFESRLHFGVKSGRYERRPAIVLGPTVDQVTSTSAVIAFTTDRPVRGAVRVAWQAVGGRERVITETEAPATSHRVRVTALSAGRRYRYQVIGLGVGDQPIVTGPAASFRTAPLPGAPVRFAFMSDGRAGTGGGFANYGGVNAAVTSHLMLDALRRGADLVLFGGDLASGYTSSATHFGMMLDTWQRVSDPVARSIPIYEGFGNHESLADFFVDPSGARYQRDKEGDASAESAFARRFANPDGSFPEPEVRDGRTGPSYRGTVYSFDHGNAHFVMLNTDYWLTGGGPASDRHLALRLLGGNRNGYVMSNQLAWLDQDLSAARRRGLRHLFVFGHEAPFPTGGHAGDAMWWNGLDDPSAPLGDVVAMRNRLLDILGRYRVTAVMVGHEHAYSRLPVTARVHRGLTHPFTQFVSGGAGAPVYAQDRSVPWAGAVASYSTAYHYLLVTVSGAEVSFRTIDIDGRVIDQGWLERRPTAAR